MAGNLLDPAFVEGLLARERCSHLLHLAWIATPGVYWTSLENMAWVQGSLGLLMNDTKLYDNLTSTMSHADSLVIDLKAHPKRYVHFSVFGRKDK